jgi:hypothetical protein
MLLKKPEPEKGKKGEEGQWPNGVSVADLGCLSRIPDPNFFHPGSALKNFSSLTQKIVSKISEI